MQYGFSLIGPLGATIVYSALGLISLLFLTDFRLGPWIRGLFGENTFAGVEPKPDEESALDRRARELEKQAKQLQEQVASTLRSKPAAEDGRWRTRSVQNRFRGAPRSRL